MTAETTPAPEPDPAPVPEPAPEPAPEPTPPEAGDGGTSDPAALEAALKKANRDGERLRRRLREFEDRDKTEAQKLTDRAEAAEKTAADARQELLRLRVANTKGLTGDLAPLAERLQGANEEEMSADADRLLELVKPNPAPGSFGGGVREQAPNVSMNDLLRQSAGRG